MFTNHLLFNLNKSNGGLRVAHQIPDLNAFFSGSSDPLVFGVEGQLGDLAVVLELSGVFTHVGHIPDLNTLSSASSGQVLPIRRNRHGVDILIMVFEGTSDLEVGVPDLDSSVPAD